MDITKKLSKTFLFQGIEANMLEKIIEEHPPTIISYKRGELIYSSADGRGLVGFVASGRCEVRIDRSDGSKTLLNVLNESQSFGILSIYSKEEFPSKIFAAVNTTVIFFNEDKIRHFVNNYSQISANLIDFLCERISFLNKKVATLSSGRVEDKLAKLLLSECEKYNSNTFPFNRQKTAERIGAGRASVYRAIAILSDEGLISLDEKTIQIIDRDGLERKTK